LLVFPSVAGVMPYVSPENGGVTEIVASVSEMPGPNDMKGTTENPVGTDAAPLTSTEARKAGDPIPLDGGTELLIDGEGTDSELVFRSTDLDGAGFPVLKGDWNPIEFDMVESDGVMHLVYTDATTRHLRTYYVSSRDGGRNWGHPVEVGGENFAMLVRDGLIFIASRAYNSQSLLLSSSEDGGASFETRAVDETFNWGRTALFLEEKGLTIAGGAGLRDPETGERTRKGIYAVESEDLGKTWSKPKQLASTDLAIRSVSFSKEAPGSITWTVGSGSTLLTYENTRSSEGWQMQNMVKADKTGPNPNVASRGTAPTLLPPKAWTYIGFVCADNNLDSFGYEDVNELEDIGSTAELNMLVLFDGDTFSGDDSYCWYIQQDADSGTVTSPEIPLTDINPTWGTELNMGDPQVAVDFIEYVYANYPAEHYLMDFWNHGGSWLYGMCSDDTASDDFTMQEVRSIYETLRADTGNITLFDVAGYDECLMSDVSVDYDEAPYVDYICNSEDSIAGDGWEYNILMGHLDTTLTDATPDMTGEECAWWIFKSYEEFYGTSGSLTTMSVINISMFLSELAPAINNLAQKGLHEIATFRADFQTAASNSQSWQGYSWQRDLVHFCENIQTEITIAESADIYNAAQGVIDAATPNAAGTQWGDPAWTSDRAIQIHNQNSNENGITIYCDDTSYDTLYDTMTFTDTNWDEFLKALWGSDANAPNNEPSVIITNPSDGGFVVINSVVSITGTASDTDGVVSRVDVSVGNQHWDAAVGTNTWSYSWDTSGWAPGWYKLMARSFDGQDFSAPHVIDVEIIVDPDLPDLVIFPATITAAPGSPQPEGTLVNLAATVRNNGTVDTAFSVELGFYYDQIDPAHLIGQSATTPSDLPPGISGSANLNWDTTGLAGFRTIYAVADPDNTVTELTDGNNAHSEPYTVDGYAVGIECSVNTSTIQAGDEHVYQMEVTNLGTMSDTIELTINNPTAWRAHFNDNPPGVSKASEARAEDAQRAPVKADFTAYHSYAEVYDILNQTASGNASICQLSVFGNSYEGRDMLVMKISDNVGVDESEPEIFIDGGIHAREWLAVEVPLYYLLWLVDNYGVDPEATWLVDNREIFIAPDVNPDGVEYAQTVDNNWRKNRNGTGTDLNRNWGGASNGDANGDWGAGEAEGKCSHTPTDMTYCGASPFSEPETQAMRDLILAREFNLTISYHTYANDIYWPWGYETTVQAPHHSAMQQTAQELAALNGYTPMQSAVVYETTGDTDDWIYGYNWYSQGKFISAHTIEISDEGTFQPAPSTIEGYCAENLPVNVHASYVAGNPTRTDPVITHTPLPDSTDVNGPWPVTADVTFPGGLGTGGVDIYWDSGSGWNGPVAMVNTVGDTWDGDIPGPVADPTVMHYYIEAVDGNGNTTCEPLFAPNEYHSYYIGSDTLFYNLTLNALETRIVNMTVVAPFSALPDEQAFIDVIATSRNDGTKTDSKETVTTIMPGIVVVQAGGDTGQYTAALDNIGARYDVTTNTGAILAYDTAIWVESSTGYPSSAEQTTIMNFLDGGGNLYINGQDIGYGLGDLGAGETSAFMLDYLHSDYISDDTGGTSVDGILGDEITDGMAGYAITGSYPENMTAIAPGESIFTYVDGEPGVTGAVKVDTGTFKVVYIGFQYFEGTDLQANKDLLMQRIIDWFVPAPQIVHTPLTDTEDTTGPYDVVATITDSSGDLNNSLCIVRYSWDGTAYNTASMSNVGDVFTGQIPGHTGDVYYYIQAEDDAGHLKKDPNGATEGAPATVHHFYAGPDTVDPIISHVPLTDTYNAQGPYAVTATITDNIGVDASTTYLHYKIVVLPNIYTDVLMTPTANPDEYTADIPGQSSGTTVYYYIDAYDVASTPNYARDPLAVNNQFQVLPDLVAPVIVHTPLTDTPSPDPYQVLANVTDNGVLDTGTIQMYYQIDGGGWIGPITMTSTGTPDFYEAYIPGQSVVGTIIDYYIEASDMANPVNTATDPAGAPASYHTFEIVDQLPLLLIEDGGDLSNYTATLDLLGKTYDTDTTPSTTNFSWYRSMIWVSGLGGPSSTEQTDLMNYLDQGGNLYINGEDIGLSCQGTTFYNGYVHATYQNDDSGGTSVDGVPGDAITDGMTGYGITGSWPENITTIAPADPIFTYADSTPAPGFIGGLKVTDGNYRVVYIGFKYFEGADPQANKTLLMDRILEWFDCPSISHVPLEDTESTSPYPVVATIIDDDLDGQDLYYQIDGGGWTGPVAMSPTANPDEYTANIPGQSWGTIVEYYIEATDLAAHVSTNPGGAPANSHSFSVSQDAVAPIITHTALADTPSTDPYTINAVITDNRTLDTGSIYLNYRLDGGGWNQLAMTPTANPDEYTADIPGQVMDTVIDYYIEAADTAGTPNVAYDPVGAPGTTHTFTILDRWPVLISDAGAALDGYTTALDNIGQTYDIGTIYNRTLDHYHVVIWAQGGGGLSAPQMENVSTFLDNGGMLYINGQDIGFSANSSGNDAWYEEYLNATYVSDDTGATLVDGMTSDEITDGMAGLNITGSWPENITAIAPGEPIFTYVDSVPAPGYTGAVKTDKGTYKTVYIGFQYFEGPDPQANKDLLMHRILLWLKPSILVPWVTHTPLGDTESTAAYPVVATISDNNLAAQNMYWQANGGGWNGPVAMTPTANPDEYEADIPGQSWGTTVDYYIEAVDGDSNTVMSPVGAPVTYHTFLVFEDVDAPAIVHTPMTDTPSQNPYTITATITDNLNLDTGALYLYYSLDNGTTPYTQVAMTPAGGDNYTAQIPGQGIGTVICYYIEATDTALTPNTGYEPAGAPLTNHSFTILERSHLILVVDDTYGSGTTAVIETALTDAGYVFDSWNVETQGEPDFTIYGTIIWDDDDSMRIDDSWAGVDDVPDKVNALMTHLDDGNRLYVCGADVGWVLDLSAPAEFDTFLNQYLHATYVSDSATANDAYGVGGDEITDGLSAPVTDFSIDSIVPFDANSDGIFYAEAGASGECIGVKYDEGNYRTAYTSFDLATYGDALDRAVLIDRIISWLDPVSMSHDAMTNGMAFQSPWANGTPNTIYTGLQDITGTVVNNGESAEAPFNARCTITRLDLPGPSHNFLSEDFESPVLWDGSNPPAGWTIEDYGDEATPTWNNNDWHQYAYGGDNVSRVYYSPVENQDEWLISPVVDFTGYTNEIYLEFSHYFNDYTDDTDEGYVDISLNGGTTWPINVVMYDTDTGSMVDERIDISAWVANQNNVQFRWRYVANDDMYWYVDDVNVSYDPSFIPVEVYNEIRTTSGMLLTGESEELVWSYNFDQIAQYIVNISTELVGDEKANNDKEELTITTIAPPAIDAQLDDITTHEDGGTYATGAQDVIADVSNQGTVAQAPFDVNCKIYREDSIPLEQYFFDDMESGAGGWTNDLLWELGTPTSGPSGAYSGANCWGTDLDADYPVASTLSLTSQWIDLTTATQASLTFWHWYSIESTYDGGIVELDPGTGFVQITPVDGYDGVIDDSYGNPLGAVPAFYGSSTWVQETFVLDGYCGNNVQIRFRFGSDDSLTYDGWFIDDVNISHGGGSGYNLVFDQTLQTSGTMNRYDIQPITWNYDFDNETYYRIETTTLLGSDANPANDLRSIVIDITGAGPVLDDVPLPVLNLSMSVDASDNPVLTWNLQAEPSNRTRSEVRIFRSADRNTWSFAGDLVYTAGAGDSTWTDTGVSSGTYYYYVRPYNVIGLSALSTMGVYHQFSFTYNAGIGNDNWLSLPHDSDITMASDIVLALEGGTGSGTDVCINYIGKWDPATQGVTEAYFYQEVGPPALWGWNGGADFAVNPGDSITVQLSGNTASFTWCAAGVDCRCTKSFTYNAGIGNDNWITVPWTGQYTMASDIVVDIEGGTGSGMDVCINYIGKWDPATQGVSESYFYQEVGPPALWGWNGGVDFAIAPGDAITIQLSGNTANFNWQQMLVSNPLPDAVYP